MISSRSTTTDKYNKSNDESNDENYVMDKFKQLMRKEKWEQYNTNNQNEHCEIFTVVSGKKQTARTYTHLFFQQYGLNAHLNNDHKRILQLGASSGLFLDKYKKEGWDVMGYDYTQSSIEYMQSRDIPCKLIDLNSITGSQLSYKAELNTDLTEPTNIFAIRILQYLDPSALTLLIFDLMNLAPNHSTFFIINSIKKYQNNPNCQPNYIASFFAPRTDFSFLKNKMTHDNVIENPDLDSTEDNQIDQILVVKKNR